MNTSQSHPPHLSYVATLLWEIQKVIFQHYYSYSLLQIIYVTSEENNSNYCTTALAVYLLLFNVPIICIALLLSLGHATGGARVLIWTCKDLRQRLVATWAEFQHSVVYYATDQS